MSRTTAPGRCRPREHLVVLRRVYFARMASGAKTIEVRASLRRRPPYGMVRAGDVLWFKVPSGPVQAAARVRRVRCICPVRAENVADLRRRWGARIAAEPGFWAHVARCRYLTVIWLGDFRRLRPVHVRKRDRRAWVPLDGGGLAALLRGR